ncbi:MAG: hypothetical protein HC836_45475 [Richelia sp. RM2_1_2]|nr:hypothetical protein [Richelia sp. RM2_1_2]
MINIHPYKQSDDSLCGPAVIKMVLQYYNISATELEIAEKCGHTYELGCDDLGMKRALESYGMDVIIQNNSSFDDMQFWLEKEIPVIVDWFSSGYNIGVADPPNGHSSIVIDLDDQYIYLLDPEFGGIRKMIRNDFMRCWFDWKNSPIIVNWEDMILRQIIVAYPNNNENSDM